MNHTTAMTGTVLGGARICQSNGSAHRAKVGQDGGAFEAFLDYVSAHAMAAAGS